VTDIRRFGFSSPQTSIINFFISFISVLTSTLTNWKQTKNGYILTTCLINFVFIHFGKSMWSFWMESNLCRIYLLIVYICISTRVQLTTRRGGGLGSPFTTTCSNPIHGEVYSIQHYVITFVSNLWQDGGFLRVIWFPPPIKLNATMYMKHCWKCH
jgi:magnesium-transporting ATPase (P-type)